jgi:phage/plasmid-like protein (TIGR03299 family)
LEDIMTASTTLPRPAHRLPAQAVLGTDVAGSRDTAEALRTAGLDWGLTVHNTDHLTLMGESGLINTSLPGQRLIMRDDTYQGLAVVGSRYTPVTNADAFAIADNARDLGATFAHAGSLDHSRKTFLTMDLPEARVRIGGKDVVDFGIVIRTSHDGSGSISGEISGKRLVCMNGMTVGIGEAQRWSIPHTASAHSRMAEILLQGAFRYAKSFAAVGEMLISQPMTSREFADYIDALYPKPEESQKAARTRWENRRGELMQLFNIANTQSEGRATRWGALNAVVEWEDWGRGVRTSTGESVDQARAARQFTNTDSAGTKQAAYRMLTHA